MTTGFGEPVGLTAIVRDVTLRKTLEEMKNDFVNTVSHDLKNPIAVIEGMATLIHRELPETGRQRERCDIILDTTRFMAELVTDLLDLGKIEAGFDPTVESAGRRARGPGHGQAARAAGRGQAHRREARACRRGVRDGDARPAQAGAAESRLQRHQVHAPGWSRERHRERRRPLSSGAPIVTIRVKDTGLGIAARDLPHVFDKFFRVESEATESVPGTGLGLAITRASSEAYCRRASAPRHVEGAGSTFTIELAALRRLRRAARRHDPAQWPARPDRPERIARHQHQSSRDLARAIDDRRPRRRPPSVPCNARKCAAARPGTSSTSSSPGRTRSRNESAYRGGR